MGVVDANEVGAMTPEADLGPFLTIEAVARRGGVPLGQVAEWTGSDRLVAVPTSDGSALYPAAQWPNGSAVGPHEVGVAEVVKVLREAGCGWLTIAQWFQASDQRFSGMNAWQWLHAGGAMARVVSAARSDAARWAQ
ncbi:hypothetical protein KC207_13725 [Phycicoccus sp. BSK3Z-2]|uniref:Uncharacterized protein n=1 Tax=Phycicoccus avicenniae TaxID=2828860 RepID=A0A941DAY7_9MICO|nr:hypothetical protein [Phycicoccus avicenniae]MBR7744348.1 hypothetical protein [Phycicoccus avicenniae]